jgi:hypothetical protein
MSDALQTTHGLLDIEPPVLPVDSGLMTTFIAIALIFLLIILTWSAIHHYTSTRSQARQRLRHLRKSVTRKHGNNNNIDSVDSRDTAYQLARLFAVGVGINGITSSTTLPVELNHHHERWQRFTSDLSAARYASQCSHPSSLDELFRETFFWLKCWP